MKKDKAGTLKITQIYIIFIVIIAVAAILVLVGSEQEEKSIRNMQNVTITYIEGQEAINNMHEASDYLTYESRAFIITGDVKDAADYYKEVEVDKRRDKSLETLAQHGDDEIYAYLESALNESNELAEVEGYAMRLAMKAYDIKPSEVPKALASIPIKSEDRSLSAEELTKKATSMVFDDSYDKMKDDIVDDVIGGLEKLMEDTRAEELASYEQTLKYSRYEHMMMLVLLLCMFAMLLITAFMVIRPIRKSATYISKNQPLPLRGSKEYSYLASTYNKMLDKMMTYQEELSYETIHDELTEVYNRKMFENKREEFENSDIAMLVVDIDYFKDVNDENGHEVGDKVLKKVASILQGSFRLEDYVCRIGGDEFAVIMVQMNPSLMYVVQDKINRVREKMAAEDDLPAATLSIGVAFSGDAGDCDVFKKADEALYETKRKGRNGYTFYSQMERPETDRAEIEEM